VGEIMAIGDIQKKLNELVDLANKHTEGMNQLELYVYRSECARTFSKVNTTEAKKR